MNGLVLLLYRIEILGALLCGANTIPGYYSNNFGILTGTTTGQESSTFPASQTTSLTNPANTSRGLSESSSSMSTQSSTTVSRAADSPSALPLPIPQPTTTSDSTFYRKECVQVLLVAGGLILACTILLISTLLLALLVCKLNRRITALSSNADLITNSEYWMGTARKSKSKSGTQETSMLMANVGETQEAMGNCTINEEGRKVNGDGQMEAENKKDVGDAVNSEEAQTTPVAASDNSFSAKPQEESIDSSTKAVAASSSEGAEDPKDVV